MVETISIKNLNSVYNQVICEPSIVQELADHLTFMVPGAKFMPKFRARLCDGKIRLLNMRNNTFYVGLNKKIEQFAKEREYEVEHLSDFSNTEFSVVEAKKFIKSLDIPFVVRDYQLKTFIQCVRQNRALVLSPTGSGKSLIIYMLMRLYGAVTLIVVPTTSLVHQMISDFQSYGYKDFPVQKILGGEEKVIKAGSSVGRAADS